jgi:uncharacterized protein involved in oxidation of intracellular sulfur
MTKILIIINDAPYGTEKAYNALRMAMTIQKEDPDTEVRIFLMADASTAALPDQNTPQGYYNIERMLRSVLSRGGRVKICGSCAEARGISKLAFIEGAELSTMQELVHWTLDSDKTLTF